MKYSVTNMDFESHLAEVYEKLMPLQADESNPERNVAKALTFQLANCISGEGKSMLRSQSSSLGATFSPAGECSGC